MKPVRISDKRQYVRFNVDAKVNFQIQKKGNEFSPVASAQAKNVSIKGVCFVSRTKIEPGSFLRLEIFLPEFTKPIHVEGQVQWARPFQQGQEPSYEVGVKLFIIDESDQAKFVTYISKLTAQEKK